MATLVLYTVITIITIMDAKNDFVYTDSAFTYKMHLDECLHISIIDDSNREEYELSLDKSDSIFDGHVIINKPETLFRVLCDGFNKATDKVVITNKVVITIYLAGRDSEKYMGLIVNVDAVYVCDTVTLELRYIDGKFAPNQMMKTINTKFDTIVKKIDSDSKVLEECKQMCDMFKEYISWLPICDVVPCKQIHMVINFTFNTEPDVCFREFSKGVQYDEYKHMPLQLLKHFSNLRKITIVGYPDTTNSLEFLQYNKALRHVVLTRDGQTEGYYPELSLLPLTKLDSLEKVTLSGQWTFTDCSELAKCANLKVVELPTGTDVSVFPKDAKFKIKLV